MEVTPEVRLKRYLHYGSEEAVYFPGCRFHYKNYTPEKFTSLTQLVSEGKEKVILDSIKKVHTENTSAYPEALVFAVAQCVRNKESTVLRAGGYILAELICTTCEFLFLFFKFTLESPPKCGTGRACRRLVKNWYLKKNALELAELVADRPKYRGWCHADILKVTHLKTNDKAKSAVFKYAVKGIQEAKQTYGLEPEAEEVLSYLSNISSFKKITNSNSAARAIESHMWSVNHVNGSLLRSKEVWMALLRIMPLPVLLHNLQWLAKKGMLRSGPAWDYDFIKVICDAMNNPATITDSGIHPSKAYIELCTYKLAASMKLDLAVKLRGRLPKQPPALCPEIIVAMEKVIRTSFKLVETTGLTYAIGIEVSQTMCTRRCGSCRYMTSSQAASLITLCLLKAEKNVDVLAFTVGQTPLKLINIPVESTIEDTETILHQNSSGPVDIESFFNWAILNKKKIDVFLILANYIKQGHPYQSKMSTDESSHVAQNEDMHPSVSIISQLKKYCQAADVPNARAILCNLSGCPKMGKTEPCSNFLTISGFDDKVCKLITSFSKGAF